jgi:hypothetical protein
MQRLPGPGPHRHRSRSPPPWRRPGAQHTAAAAAVQGPEVRAQTQPAPTVNRAALQTEAGAQQDAAIAAILAARGPLVHDGAWAAALRQERLARTGTCLRSVFEELMRVPDVAAALDLRPGQTTRPRHTAQCGQLCVCQSLSG